MPNHRDGAGRLSSCRSLAALLFALGTAVAGAATITFEDLSLPANSYYLGPDANPAAGVGTASTFATGGALFHHYYDAQFFSWAGFSFSTGSDAATPGFFNQQSAQSGAGASGSTYFGLAYDDTFTPFRPTLSLGAGHYATSLLVSNTAYAFHYMDSGLDGFFNNPANQFGGLDGSDNTDYLLLTIEGYDAGNSLTGSVQTYLADYRFTDPAQDFILTGWNAVDLTPLGPEASTLRFLLSSNDFNVPAYFAVDNIVILPEPGAAALLCVGLMFAGGRRLRRAGG
jgi:hypothetical protein